jgi:hypothetical protein
MCLIHDQIRRRVAAVAVVAQAPDGVARRKDVIVIADHQIGARQRVELKLKRADFEFAAGVLKSFRRQVLLFGELVDQSACADFGVVVAGEFASRRIAENFVL